MAEARSVVADRSQNRDVEPFSALAPSWHDGNYDGSKRLVAAAPLMDLAKSQIPGSPTFVRQPADTPISEVAMRVVVEFEGKEAHVIGTATIVAGYLAVTAGHVLDDIVERFGKGKPEADQFVVSDYAIRLIQITPGPHYVLWSVHTAWRCRYSDLALLHLGLHRTSSPEIPVAWRTPRMRLLPPPVGSPLAGFGYHSSRVEITPKPDGNYHIDLQDDPTATTGRVEEILDRGQPSGKFRFPCFRVNARFDGGMSGGPVYDEHGALCGIISGTMFQGTHEEEPISYVATLWPMLKTVISADRGDRFPRGVQYPMIDLALDGQIHTVGLSELDPREFPDKTLPR